MPGLVDELIVPVLLGDGVRLYDVPGGERVALERIESESPGQFTDLRFRVTR